MSSSLLKLFCGTHFSWNSIVEFTIREGRCKWWRLSFSAAETKIVLHADGKYRYPTTNHKTCRKNVLRLLKYDLYEFYCNKRLANHQVSSYYIKTIFLHLLEKLPELSQWFSEQLRYRYLDALALTVSRFESGVIEHYFIAGENLLSDKHIPRKQLSAIKRHFLDKKRLVEGAAPDQ